MPTSPIPRCRGPASTTSNKSMNDTKPRDLAISTRGLTKRYGDFTAVDHVDLDIKRGEIFALLGPNGAGKSTTIEMLEGYRSPTSGTLTVLGETPLGADASWRSRIGIVSQQAADIERFTVREIVRHFASLYPDALPPEETLERCGLGAKMDARVPSLSGGQKRRLDVALGIIGKPELLFLDEPTTGFDPAARREFWELIRDLGRDGTTILLTTHYLDEAEHLAQRVGVIARGRLLEVAPIDELGGLEARVPIVSWRDASGRQLSERTRTPGALVAKLLAEQGGESRDLAVKRPSLEDIYLAMLEELEADTTDTRRETATGPVMSSAATPRNDHATASTREQNR